jgi:hypothetical protein
MRVHLSRLWGQGASAEMVEPKIFQHKVLPAVSECRSSKLCSALGLNTDRRDRKHATANTPTTTNFLRSGRRTHCRSRPVLGVLPDILHLVPKKTFCGEGPEKHGKETLVPSSPTTVCDCAAGGPGCVAPKRVQPCFFYLLTDLCVDRLCRLCRVCARVGEEGGPSSQAACGV